MTLANFPGIPDNSTRFTDDEREMPSEVFVGKLCFITGIQDEPLLELYDAWEIMKLAMEGVPNGTTIDLSEVRVHNTFGSPIFKGNGTATPQHPVALRCGSDSGVTG